MAPEKIQLRNRWRLGDGALVMDPVARAAVDYLAAFEGRASFEVIAYTAIAVRKPRDWYQYEGRSHSLWFVDTHEAGVYRWFEIAFMVNPIIAQRFTLEPLE